MMKMLQFMLVGLQYFVKPESEPLCEFHHVRGKERSEACTKQLVSLTSCPTLERRKQGKAM